MALYTDWKTVYVKEATEQQLLRGEVPETQFGRMCKRLGIRIIAANSPQAKGRVERNHGTHQDRLVKKLRRKKIGNYATANELLKSEYRPDHNRRFGCAAASPEDYHHKTPSNAALDEAFRLETDRVIGNDWVVRYGNRFLQVNRQATNLAPAKGKVVVCEWEDGRVEIQYRERKVDWEEIAERPLKAKAERLRQAARPHTGTPPAPSHPWKQRYDGMRTPGITRPAAKVMPVALGPQPLGPKRSAYGLAGLSGRSSQGNEKRTRPKRLF